jgi:hypothetical protein
LEFASVIVSAPDHLPNPMERDEVRDSSLLYVELARATYHLVVTRARRSAFTDRGERSVRR